MSNFANQIAAIAFALDTFGDDFDSLMVEAAIEGILNAFDGHYSTMRAFDYMVAAVRSGGDEAAMDAAFSAILFLGRAEGLNVTATTGCAA